MGRKAQSVNHKKTHKSKTHTSQGSDGVISIGKSSVEQLHMLRAFLADTGSSWTEADLTDCLRQCGYNVERAAERLMTGKYQKMTSSSSSASSFNAVSQPAGLKKKTGSSLFVAMTSDSPLHPSKQASAPSKTSNQTTKVTPMQLSERLLVVEKDPSSHSHDDERNVTPRVNAGTPALKRELGNEKVRSEIPRSTAVNQKKVPNRVSLSHSKSGTPFPEKNCGHDPNHHKVVNLEETSGSTGGHYILCQRWVSDAICTTKKGSVAYKEPLTFSPSQSGYPTIRFQGQSGQLAGKLADHLAVMLTPLLRMDATTTPLIHLSGEALMEQSRLPLGAHVPISITVTLPHPRSFFELFDVETSHLPRSLSSQNSYFDNKERKPTSTALSKKLLPTSQAAFDMLQWAEYGDSPQYAASVKEDAGENIRESNNEEGDEDEPIEMNEDDFEAASVAESTAEGLEISASVTGGNEWAASLPEADHPEGFAPGIELRPYQKQALYWMSRREQDGESREELERQLSLLEELVNHTRKAASPSLASFHSNGRREIVCECGPVRVTEQVKKQSKTLDGAVDPVNHPLWRRRFLASPDMSEAISFYVNELLGQATHCPPAPPSPCSGGILADTMGLGKTVMLMALILKSKQERTSQPTDPTYPSATLVVAKLSLLPQWEDELKSKTSLSYLIYYGQQGTKSLSGRDLEAVDVVITTYGTVQGELQRKNPALLDCSWLRIILDEAHCIRNSRTVASKACCSLKAVHRWCVSGTIIQNSLEDVYGVMKFLRHEPWSVPTFWKSAISKPMSKAVEEADPTRKGEKMTLVLDRVRRVLAPIMIRRTKDSVSSDGKPILTLPKIETKIIKVDFTESEREFYKAVLVRSLEVFDGFVKAGTAAKSYIQIFSLLQRLRQVCDHIALTVRTRFTDSVINECKPELHPRQLEESIEVEGTSKNSLGKSFLSNLLEKFCEKTASPRKQKRDHPTDLSPPKRHKDVSYRANVAKALSFAVQSNSAHVMEECPICLERPKLEEAVVTPCAHIFCRHCLLDFLQDKSPSKRDGQITSLSGPCPCCTVPIQAGQIITLVNATKGGSTLSPSYLSDTSIRSTDLPEVNDEDEVDCNDPARQILEQALLLSDSSKIVAIMNELKSIWELDPGSKVIMFSHYLGFLDLMGNQFRSKGIPFFRLDGSLTLKERMSVLEQFRAKTSTLDCSGSEGTSAESRGSVLLISMAAGGEGLNLVSASSCFICDPWWNAAKEDQCVNRIHRIGQTAQVVRVRKFIVNDSVEERIVQLQGRKKYVAGEIYSDTDHHSAEAGGARLSLEEFKLIFHGAN